MHKLRHRVDRDIDLAPWEAELAQRLLSLRDIPTPPSLATEATDQFMRRLRVQPVKAAVPARPSRAPSMRLGMRFAALLVACLASLSGVGYATASSLPGDALYGLKRQVETVQLAVSPTDQQPALTERLLDRRLDEVVELVGQHASKTQIDAGVAEYAAATASFGHTSAALDKQAVLRRHLVVLTKLEAGASHDDRAALQTAQQAAEEQLTQHGPRAPVPTAGVPAQVLSPTRVSATPTSEPSATTTPVAPTVARPPRGETTAQEPRRSVVQTALPTATIVPTEAKRELPKATVRPQEPGITPSPAAPKRPVNPTRVHGASPQKKQPGDDTHSQTPAATPVQPNSSGNQGAPPQHETAVPSPERPNEGMDRTAEPSTEHGPPQGGTGVPEARPTADGGQQQPTPDASRVPEHPGDDRHQSPEQPSNPADPAAPSPHDTAVPSSDHANEGADRTAEPSTQHDPPPAPPKDKTQAPGTKPTSDKGRQPPPAPDDTHKQPPNKPGPP